MAHEAGVTPLRYPELSDSVRFEIPTRLAARGLLARLTRERGRRAWLYPRGDLTIVEAMLPPEPLGLAQLLRDVEAWVVDYGVGSIRWQLDGRRYVMYAGVLAWLSALGAG